MSALYVISGISQLKTIWNFPLLFLVFLSATGCIWVEYHRPRWLFYILKPLTMVLIILVPLLGGQEWTIYKSMIILGLIFSLAGDVFLMLPSDRFLLGLTAFLATHLCYIWAFCSKINALNWLPLLPLISIGALLAYSFSPDLGKLKIPAYLYTGMILGMFWLAWTRFIQESDIENMLVFLGAGLFVISDLILAVVRFKVGFKQDRIIILGTYFTAQWLIASSVGFLVQ